MLKKFLLIIICFIRLSGSMPIEYDIEEELDTNSYIASEITVNDDDDTLTKAFRLNKKFEFKCSNMSGFHFKEIIFNQSLSDLNSLLTKHYKLNSDYMIVNDLIINIKSINVYKQAFNQLDKFNLQEIIVPNVKYSQSGHYYCVYTKNDEYFIKTSMITVYDEEVIRKKLNEIIELSPCWDPNQHVEYIQWKINYEPIKTNNKTLVLHLTDLNMFDSVYQCQNIETGAYKLYFIECLNRDIMYPSPLVSPVHQQVTTGSQTIFTCDKTNPSSREPDRYQWFIQPEVIMDQQQQGRTAATDDDFILKAFNLDMSKTIGNGPILELNNLTSNDSGWYICCLLYNKERHMSRRSASSLSDYDYKLYNNNNSFEHSCSMAELKIHDFNTNNNNNNNIIPKVLSLKTKILIVLIIIVSCLILIVGISFLSYCGYSKYFTYLKTVRAAQTMYKNDLYQSSNPDSHMGNLNLDAKLDHFKQILTSSSSIESLLNKDDIKKWRINIKDLTFGHVIGRGAFGVVMYADLRRKQTIALSTHVSTAGSGGNGGVQADNDSGLDSEVYHQVTSDNNKKSIGSNSVVVTKNMSVAVKKLPENATSENFLDLFKELNLMFQVGQHSHIINLIGYSIEESSLYIITDYARHGNLKDFLRKHYEMNNSNNILIGPDTLLLYSYQISLGMEYLHSKKVLHRDLAARNILVDDYDSIKIADFGLARNIRTDYYYVQQREGKMPLKWMSPEALSFNRISNESDIWSYGILLWEIYTYGSTPYPSIQAENILANLNSGYRMEKPVDCDQYIYDEIILNCWRLEPKKRPTFTQLVDLFKTSEHLNLKNLLNLNKQQQQLHKQEMTMSAYDEQTSQSTKMTNASVASDCSFNITSASTTTPIIVLPEQQLNSSSNFLSTSSSSSSYNPTSSSSSSSSSSVNSPSSIFYEHNLLNEKLLEKINVTSTSSSSATVTEQIKENNNNNNNSKSINRIKTPKTQSIRKFAYRTNERKHNNLRLLGKSSNKKAINSNRYYDYENDDVDDDVDVSEEKQLFSKYSLVSEKSITNNGDIKKKNKFLLTYV